MLEKRDSHSKVILCVDDRGRETASINKNQFDIKLHPNPRNWTRLPNSDHDTVTREISAELHALVAFVNWNGDGIFGSI
jgi:hypothetical protein